MQGSPLSEVVEVIESIAQERKVEIVIHLTPHGNFIEVILGSGFKRCYDFDMEMDQINELGLDPSNRDFINDLINQTIDQVTDHFDPSE